jgi:hypothetical protein
VILTENIFPFCKPESNPAGFPLDVVKYTQGSANELCVTELSAELLNVHCMSIVKKTFCGELLRGENECHNGAITCGEVGRRIAELTTGRDLNLRRSSTKMRAAMNASRTQVLVDGQIAWTEGELVLVGAVALVPATFDPESEEPPGIVISAVTVPVLACPADPDPDPDPEDRELVGVVGTGLDMAPETESLAVVVCSVLDGTGEAKELAGAVAPGFDGGAEIEGPAGVVSPGPVGAAGAAEGAGVPSD